MARAKKTMCRLCGRYAPDAKQNRLLSGEGVIVVCAACRMAKRGAVRVPDERVSM